MPSLTHTLFGLEKDALPDRTRNPEREELESDVQYMLYWLPEMNYYGPVHGKCPVCGKEIIDDILPVVAHDQLRAEGGNSLLTKKLDEHTYELSDHDLKSHWMQLSMMRDHLY